MINVMNEVGIIREKRKGDCKQGGHCIGGP